MGGDRFEGIRIDEGQRNVLRRGIWNGELGSKGFGLMMGTLGEAGF